MCRAALVRRVSPASTRRRTRPFAGDRPNTRRELELLRAPKKRITGDPSTIGRSERRWPAGALGQEKGRRPRSGSRRPDTRRARSAGTRREQPRCRHRARRLLCRRDPLEALERIRKGIGANDREVGLWVTDLHSGRKVPKVDLPVSGSNKFERVPGSSADPVDWLAGSLGQCANAAHSELDRTRRSPVTVVSVVVSTAGESSLLSTSAQTTTAARTAMAMTRRFERPSLPEPASASLEGSWVRPIPPEAGRPCW